MTARKALVILAAAVWIPAAPALCENPYLAKRQLRPIIRVLSCGALPDIRHTDGANWWLRGAVWPVRLDGRWINYRAYQDMYWPGESRQIGEVDGAAVVISDRGVDFLDRPLGEILAAYDVLLLGMTPDFSLTESRVSKVKSFVEQGGGLIYCAHGKDHSLDTFLPATCGAPDAGGGEVVPDAEAAAVAGKVDWKKLGEVKTRSKLIVRPGGKALAAFADGAPFLVSGGLGRGRMLVVAVPYGNTYGKDNPYGREVTEWPDAGGYFLNSFRWAAEPVLKMPLAQAPAGERDISELKARMEQARKELADAKSLNYPVFHAEQELAVAEHYLRRLPEVETLGEFRGSRDTASEALRRLKGFLICVRIPQFSKEMPGGHQRMPGFRQLSGCYAYPADKESIRKKVDEPHSRGHLATLYFGMHMPYATYPWLPGDERWRAMRDGKKFTYYPGSGTVWSCLAFKEWSEQCIDSAKFAARLGFDSIELDESYTCAGCAACQEFRRSRGMPPTPFGATYKSPAVDYIKMAGSLREENPEIAVCTNAFGWTAIDEPEYVYNVQAMHETVGGKAQLDWDYAASLYRGWVLHTGNVPTYGVLYLSRYFKPGYWYDITTASAQASRVMSMVDPCGEPTESFMHRYSDYIFGDFVDLYLTKDCLPNTINQEVVRSLKDLPKVRMYVNERNLPDGTKDLVIHLFSIDDGAIVTDIPLEVDTEKVNLGGRSSVTILSPGLPAHTVQAAVAGGKLSFRVPSLKMWNLVVVGAPVGPTVKLDTPYKEVHAGERFEVTAEVENVGAGPVSGSVALRAPEDWEIGGAQEFRLEQGQKTKMIYQVTAGSRPRHEFYAIYPEIAANGVTCVSWPVKVQLRPADEVRLWITPQWTHGRTEREQFVLHGKSTRDKPVSLTVKAQFPDGWKPAAANFTLTLEPHKEAVSETVTVAIPVQDQSLWDRKDVKVKLTGGIEGAERSWESEVRVFRYRTYIANWMLGCFADGAGPPLIRLGGWPNFYLDYATSFSSMAKAAGQKIDSGDYAVAFWASTASARDKVSKYEAELQKLLDKGVGLVFQESIFTPQIEFKGEFADNSDFSASKLCPVEFLGKSSASTITFLPNHVITRDLPFKSFTASKEMEVAKVKAKDWAKVIATWEDGTPAVVVSTDPKRRVAYIGCQFRREGCTFSIDAPEKWALIPFYARMSEWAGGMLR